jgi:ADP-ribose pyrophosphatase
MLPSGRVDKEQDIAEAAQRELREETGYRAQALEFYCSTRHSEAVNFANHLFLARDLVEDPLTQDADELIEVHVLPLAEAIEKTLGSPVVHTASAYGLLRYAREKGF